MNATTPFKEELELGKLLEKENELFQRHKEFEENQRRIELERAERERTIPPLDDLALRERMRAHQVATTRGEIKNILRDQNQSLLLLLILIAATCALVWWGIKLMQA